jgi:hypothetical protein
MLLFDAILLLSVSLWEQSFPLPVLFVLSLNASIVDHAECEFSCMFFFSFLQLASAQRTKE